MDERVASMREFVANFWISETLRGEFDSGCVAVSSVFQSSRDPHLRTSLTHESIVILLGGGGARVLRRLPTNFRRQR
jgi:hypothetical protein